MVLRSAAGPRGIADSAVPACCDVLRESMRHAPSSDWRNSAYGMRGGTPWSCLITDFEPDMSLLQSDFVDSDVVELELEDFWQI